MPRRPKGAYLAVRRARVDQHGKSLEAATWIIRDGQNFRRTGCAVENLAGAEEALRAYLADKYEANRTPRRRSEDIDVADVLNVYAQDRAGLHGRPHETAARLQVLAAYWAGRTLSEISGKTCRDYARSRPSQTSARRELEDLRSAINHHRREGLCQEVISVVLPERSAARDRWLTRSEAAKLIWAAYRYREVQKGCATGRRSRQHVARFILLGIYTGTRAGAICSAAFVAGPGQGFLDLDRGIFYRKKQDARETKKRQPPVRLPDRVVAHLRRWRRLGISQNFAVEFNGQPIGRVNKAFARVVADVGLGAEVTPHVLRHTAATWTMSSGVDIAKAAGFLGMTSEMLERVYGHHHPDFQEEAAAGVSEGARSLSAQKRRKKPRTNDEDR